MYFVFVDWIENLIKRCKKQGGTAYWIWMFAVALAGFVSGFMLGIYGFNETVRKMLAIALIIYIVPIPLVYYFEKKRHV